MTTDGKVILNIASADELTKLPRVGPKRAQAILELRRKLGRFRQPTDLLRVRGIGRKTLKLMLPLLVVDAPAT
jgi:competence protein ComEA